ncbi:DUF1579 domain-containing protein [candidate division KSB1 bacterium]|nr:DUF1579 domain-containing protein [candidate division KSB1 bacterium]
MKLAEIQEHLLGDWNGANLLRLSWLTPSDYHSFSRLSVAPVANGKFLSFKYTWSHEDVAQEGLILLGYDDQQGIATAAWVDSWHMSSKIMSCQGAIDEQGAIILRGSYEAPPGPDWGWRIVITPKSGSGLQIVMYTISPEGLEDLAVQADYKRGK